MNFGRDGVEEDMGVAVVSANDKILRMPHRSARPSDRSDREGYR
jgi:hypothetical protein